MTLKVILTSNMYLPNTGGIENSLYALAKVGMLKGDDVTIITSNIVDGADNLPPGEELDEQVRIQRYDTPLCKNKFARVFQHVRSAISTYRSEYIQNKEAIVIARYHWNVIFAYFAGYRNIRYLVPGIVKYQNSKANRSDQNPIGLFIEQLIQRFALGLSSDIFVFSNSMEKQVKSIYNKKKITKVCPGVDFSRFQINTQFSDNSVINLLTVSRLVAAKGLNYAIEALVYLPKEYILNIVGDGPDLEQLKKFAKFLKVDKRVVFLGKLSKPEKQYYISDIFLLPSIYEPFGQTILEASASGIPVVSFDPKIVDTATKDIIGDFGVYAEKLCPKTFAESIIIAKKRYDENTLLAEQVREYIIEKYSWSNLYGKLTY